MTPVYNNGSDYYKKMLELQKRLRRSEEERIRLEERFSLLEHESRSRHETCINRLRMRYIEFLEEQQARDERNHKLLGALDRVDSSLALISAKTDRLGSMRKQYEAASLFKNWYVNRRANGSVAGDSGVASQNNEAHSGRGTRQERIRSNRYSANQRFVSATHPSITNMTLGNVGSAVTSRTHYSPSRELSDFSYDTRRPARIRNESSQMLPDSPKFSSAFHRGETSIAKDADARDRTQFFTDNRRGSVSQTQTFHQSPRKYRFNNQRFNDGAYESTAMQSPFGTPNDSSLGYFRDIAETQPATRRAALPGKDVFKTVAPIQNYSGFYKNDIYSSTARSPSTFPKVVDTSSREFGDEEDVYRVGDIVENELERYMNRIPRLYREADCPQSSEEHDHEQNTSGDLLNVTLSDDDVDFLAEERPRDDGTSAVKLKTAPSESNRVWASRQIPTGSRVADVYQNVSAGESGNAKEAREMGTGEGDGLDETRREQLQRRNRDFPIASDAVLRKLPSITLLSNATDTCDNGVSARHFANNEKIAALAKNGISLDVARDGTESGARPSRNNENIAKSCENSNREINTNTMEARRVRSSEERDDAGSRGNTEADGLLVGNDRDKVNVNLCSTDSGEFDGSKYKVVSGEEHGDAGNHFDDYTEDLEPWNLSTLERRVQGSMILKDESEPQSDLIPRESNDDPSAENWPDREREINESRTGDADGQLTKGERKTEELMDKMGYPNDEMSWNNGTGASIGKPFRDISDVTNEGEISSQRPREQKNGTNASSVVANESTDGSTREFTVDALQEPSAARESDYLADQNVGYGRGTEETYPDQGNVSYLPDNNDQVPNLQYEYPVDEQYQEGSNNEHYQPQQYDGQNVQYDGDPSGGQQYQYELNDQQQYQGYIAEADSNYPVDSNEQYGANDNQRYADEQSEQYVADANQQYAEGSNEQYVADTNQQYAVDSNEQYVTGPDQQYAVDPNQEYLGEAQRYPEGGDYIKDTNQAYPDVSPADMTYPEVQEYAGTEVYGQSSLPENEGYAAESEHNQEYGQSGLSENEGYAAESENNQDYGQSGVPENQGFAAESGHNQEYVQSGLPENEEYAAESEHNQEYVQSGLPENEGYAADSEHNQDYGHSGLPENEGYAAESQHNQDYVQSGLPENEGYAAESEHNQDYGQGHETSVEFDETQGYRQGYEASMVPDQSQGYGQGYETSVKPDDSAEHDKGRDKSATYEPKANIQETPSTNELSGGNKLDEANIPKKDVIPAKKTKDVIKSLLDSDTESTIEKNISNAESDFDFN